MNNLPNSINLLYKRRSYALKLASEIQKSLGLSWGEAQRMAWKNIKVIIAMYQDETVEFSYLKVLKKGQTTPEKRAAVGTRNLNLIPSNMQPKESNLGLPLNELRYFDITSNGWRSYRLENIIL